MSIIPETAAERRRRLLERATSTYLDHVEEQPPGRFNKIEPQTVVGKDTAAPKYPAANPPWSGPQPPPELPFNVAIEIVERKR